MTNPIAKSSDTQIQIPKRGTNTLSIELLSTHKLLESQKVQFSTNIPEATWIPCHHLKSCYDRWQSQEENKQYSSYRQTNYHIKKHTDKINLCGSRQRAVLSE